MPLQADLEARQAFLAAVPAEVRAALAEVGDLDERLAGILAAARNSTAELDDAPGFLAFVGERLGAEGSAQGELERLHVGDLALSYGCCRGHAASIARFRAEYLPRIRAFAARGGALADLDDTVEETLVRLLVPPAPGALPGLAKYAGRSSLATWLRVVVTRNAQRAAQKERGRRGHEVTEIADRALGEDDPWLAQMKATYRVAFKQAFRSAFQELDPAARNILRYEHVDGLNLDRMAVILGVHRATVARRRQAVREELLQRTRGHLGVLLGLSPGEIDSVMRLIESHLDASVSRLLAG